MADQHFDPINNVQTQRILGRKLAVTMTAISIVSTRSAREARAHDDSPKAVVLFCCFGLVASLSLMIFGIDLSAGWL